MKFTKKISLLLFFISVSLNVFAQDNEYQKHLEKAKEYESQKRWVYALGEYWDAMEIEQTGNINEAFSSISNLKNTIENGNPGYGNFGEFDYYDEWLNLMIDYERYWTEHCPYYFTYSFEKSGINLEKRTAEYKVNQDVEISPRCKFMTLIFYHGLDNANKKFWDKDLVEFWPNISAYNFVKGKTGNFIDGTALITNSYFSKYKMPAAFASLYPFMKQNEFRKFVVSYFSAGRTVESIQYSLNCFLPYKISFALKNSESGEILYTTKPSLYFNKRKSDMGILGGDKNDLKPELNIEAGQELIQLIDASKIEVTVNSIELIYGNISKEFTWDNLELDLGGNWAAELSTKSIIAENIQNDLYSQFTKILDDKKKINDLISQYKENFYNLKQRDQYDSALSNIDEWYKSANALVGWYKKYGTQEEIQKSENELNDISAIKEETKKEASKSKTKKAVQSLFGF